MRVQSVKTGKYALVVEQTEAHVQLALQDGSNETVQIAPSTFKRWWKKADEQVEVDSPQNQPDQQAEEPQTAQQATEESTLVEESQTGDATQESDASEQKEEQQPNKKRGPKNPNVQLLLNEIEERTGEPVGTSPYFVYQGVRKFFHSSGTIAVRESDAKRVGLAYEKKNYNHPFRAKVVVPDTSEGIAQLIEILLNL